MIKSCVLAFLNGSKITDANKGLRNDLYDLGIGLILDIEKSSTLMRIFHTIKQVKISIRQRGYTDVIDTEGVVTRIPLGTRIIKKDTKKHKIGDRVIDRYDGSVNTHLSCIYSFYELQMIAPLFNVAMKSTDFTIVAYQYDGCSIKVKEKDRVPQIIKRLNKALKRVTDYYGFDTYLVQKT